MPNILLLLFYLTWIYATVNCQEIQYNLSASAVLDTNNAFNISLSIFPTKGTVSIHITGPDSKWFGIGFDSTVMPNTYAIICSKRTPSNSICQENQLGNPGATGYGQQLPETITVTRDNAQNQIRTVYITRNITIRNASYFSFPEWSQSINIIYAIGNSDIFTSSTTSMGPGGSTSLHIQSTATKHLTTNITPCGAKISLNEIIIYPSQDIVQLNMSGPSDVWYGIGFNSTNMGPHTYVIVCDHSTCHENHITTMSYGTPLTSTIHMVYNESNNGRRNIIINRKRKITASDSTDFAQYFEFPVSTATIPIIYAIGQSNTWSSSGSMSFNSSTYGITNIKFISPNDNTTNDTMCKPGVISYGTEGDVDNGFTIGLHIYCDSKTIQLSIDYTDYSPNWFGIVFNTQMAPSPNATVFTTGKPTETQRSLALYAYDLGSHDSSQVVYHKERDWTQIKQSVIDNKVSLLYEQELSNTKWDIFTTSISFRYAWGTSAEGTQLQQHTSTSHSKVWQFNLATGAIASSGSSALQIAHGIIMFLSWSVLTSVSIFSSRYRLILYQKIENKAMWFFVHRGVQSVVVILVLIGFGIAVYFTQKDDHQHFSNLHEYFGLSMVILAVLQPINAWFRPHPPTKGELKSVGRSVWEIIHKSCGYIAWIAAQITIYLGIGEFTSNTIYQTVLIVWVGFIVAVYCVLWIYNAYCFILPMADERGEGETPLLSNAYDADNLQHGISPNHGSVGLATPESNSD